MSTEDDKLPNDDHLSALYRQQATEQPPAHLDEAIVAAARREANSRPHPAYSPFSSNWRVPVSLVAVLVLAISIVNLMRDDDTIYSEFEPSNGIAVGEGDMNARQDESTVAEQKQRERAILRKKAAETGSELRKDKAELNGSVALSTPPPSTGPGDSLPAKTPVPASAPAEQPAPLEEEVVARARLSAKPDYKQDSVQTGTANGLLADRIAPKAQTDAQPTAVEFVPGAAFIRKLREDGKTDEANRAADAFLRHYFPEDNNKAEAQTFRLPRQEWLAMITELRALDRNKDADRLDNLLQQLAKQPPGAGD